MRLVCAPSNYVFPDAGDELEVILYGRADRPTRGSAGATARDNIIRRKLHPHRRAWDFLSLALAATAADLAGHRCASPDGWTREFELEVAMAEPAFWLDNADLVDKVLSFLTTDRWRCTFTGGGYQPHPPKVVVRPDEDCVALLSGGLDSFIGNVDLISGGKRPFAVSQTVRGDAGNQRSFASILGLGHLQLNHNVEVPDPETPPSQRARSLIFLAFGVLAATTLQRYQAGERLTLYVCENGFISINPPLTGARLGSLSTRTTHPVFIGLVQRLLDAAALNVEVVNPYRTKTKGEMMVDCRRADLLAEHASATTSCGRFLQHGYKHCGRCVPCLVRRAAFLRGGLPDTTQYVFQDLGRNDDNHAGFDDVRAVAMAVAEARSEGLENWIGMALSSALIEDLAPIEAMLGRGLDELAALLKHYGVK